ncbi:unnamed protein product [Lactuca saligna]|uniref:NB-ARC domain-containing protein n=1 Tax=Lactuca saligna TaxID=75948 RepID=A0AA35Z247_LACSI|nr:unnamed protein product [Lactuca saligna]
MEKPKRIGHGISCYIIREAKFIQKIVEELSLELRAINFSIDEKLVGMETRIKDVLSSLGSAFDDVRMIGIKGMGGGGKTTLARAVFDQISFQFEGASFVENGISVSSVYDGKNKMKRRMPGKKVLLVLDDVDHLEQLEALAGETNWFKPGSRIIITTRDEQVLVAHGVKSIHNVVLLLDEEAICLFSKYAFGRMNPNPGYEELSQQVVHYAAGLPLTIKVLASFLCGKNELEWIDALERLKTIPLMETLQKLEISYISLEEDYKEIFLNVACFLKGWPKARALNALESCGFHARNGLRVLEQKSLITIHNNIFYAERLGMHDHIEELGKNIVRRSHPDKPNKHSRLWINKEIVDILSNKLGTEATRYIQLYTSELSPEILMKGLRKMKELRFLDVSIGFIDPSKSDCSNPNQKFNKWSNALQYLRWNHYPFTSLTKTFQANNLVTLDMAHSRIVQLWEGGERKVLSKLRFLDLNNSMLRTLDLGLTPNIETLNLKGCGDLVEVQMPARCLKLKTVDLSWSALRTLDLGSAPNLELIDLEGCSDLVELQMPCRSPNMSSIKLANSKLRTLDIGLTPNLKYFDLKLCYDLEKVHMADKCPKLTYLDISYSKLKNLDLRLTPNLETLDLENCNDMEELHIANGCLTKLVYLNLNRCLRFKSFKFWIESVASRNKYDSSCSEDESLEVGSIAELHLIVESLDGCPIHPNNNLPKFQFTCFYKEDKPLLTRNLEKLISVGLCACMNHETFSRSICGLQHLKKIKLEGSILEAPKDVDQLEYLEELDLSYTEIKNLPDTICVLKRLKSLKVKSCWNLEKLPKDLGRLECLKKLILSSAKIKELPDSICMLKHLELLNLSFCLLLETLPEEIGRLENLKKLTLSSAKIKDLPDSICMLKNLESLQLHDCLLLEKLPEDLGRLKYLKHLNLSFCKHLRDIPESIYTTLNIPRDDLGSSEDPERRKFTYIILTEGTTLDRGESCGAQHKEDKTDKNQTKIFPKLYTTLGILPRPCDTRLMRRLSDNLFNEKALSTRQLEHRHL